MYCMMVKRLQKKGHTALFDLVLLIDVYSIAISSPWREMQLQDSARSCTTPSCVVVAPCTSSFYFQLLKLCADRTNQCPHTSFSEAQPCRYGTGLDRLAAETRTPDLAAAVEDRHRTGCCIYLQSSHRSYILWMPSACCGTVAPNIAYVAQGTTGMRPAASKLNPLFLDARAKPTSIAERLMYFLYSKY